MKDKLVIITEIFIAVILLLVIYFLVGWKIPVHYRINSLNLPEGTETVYKTKTTYSDVYWAHYMGEKVIKCEEGLEAAEAYILENNSEKKLKNIKIVEYFGMTDDAIYYSDYDDNFDPVSMTAEEMDKYIKIIYYKKLSK